MSKQFYRKWEQVYRLAKRKAGEILDGDGAFGEVEKFAKKKVGSYHVIRNISYAQKKGSMWMSKTREDNSICLPFNSSQFHFNLSPYFEILSFVDLATSQLVMPNRREDEEKLNTEDYKTDHIIKISKSPIAHGHSIFVPYLRENLPQVLTPKLIESIIKLSGILPEATIGFNSQGGGSSVNHFHAQVISPQSLLTTPTFHFAQLPSQHMTTLLFDGSRGASQIRVSSFEFISSLYIKIESPKYKLSDPEVLQGVVKAVWQIAQLAIQAVVPHNINIPDPHTIYFILRNFAIDQVKFGWVQMSGVRIATSIEQFQNITEQQISSKYARIALPRSLRKSSFLGS